MSNASVLFAAGFQTPGAGAVSGDQTGAAGFEALLGMMLGQPADAQTDGQLAQDPAAQSQTQVQPPAAPQSPLGLLTEIRVNASAKDEAAPDAAPQDADDAPVATTIENSLLASLFAPVPAPPPAEASAPDATTAQDTSPDIASTGFPSAVADEVLSGADLAPIGEAIDAADVNMPAMAQADAPAPTAADLKAATTAMASADARAARAPEPATPRPTPSQAEPAETAETAAPVQASQTASTSVAATATAATQPRPVERAAEPRKAERHAEVDTASADTTDIPNTAVAANAAPRPGAGTETANAAKADGKAGAKVAGVETAAQELAPSSAKSQPADDAQPPIQTAETSSTQGSTPTSQAAAHPVRGAPETVANLAAQIIRKLDARTTRFDLALDPIGLGQVDVRVEINAQGRVTAALSFDNPQAAAEVRSRASELQKALEQAGFDITGGMSFDVAGDQGRSGQNGRGLFDQESGAAFRGRAFQNAMNTTEAADTAPTGVILRRRDSGVDVRI